jgi:hypothetical protein
MLAIAGRERLTPGAPKIGNPNLNGRCETGTTLQVEVIQSPHADTRFTRQESAAPAIG